MGADLDFDALRERMVREQIAARGVTERRVLAAMRAVPRHLFVPAEQASLAYDDRPLPIGEGQTISQPFMVATMTEALSPQPGDRALEVGAGSGYQAAVLAFLVREVITIERHPPLAARAEAGLAAAGVTNVRVLVGDGSKGLPEAAPFERILVTAGAPSVPEALREQLADGGRLVVPVGPANHQVVTVITRRGNGFEQQTGDACVFVPLLGRFGWNE